jgi:hypothetical protein
MKQHGMLVNSKKSVAGVQRQGCAGGGHDKGYESDIREVWDQTVKELWTGFYL